MRARAQPPPPATAAWAPERDALLARLDAAERQIIFFTDRDAAQREKAAAAAGAARAREGALSRALHDAHAELAALRGVRAHAAELEKEAAALRGRLAAADVRAGHAERVATDAQRLLRTMAGEASALAERARAAEESRGVADASGSERSAREKAPRASSRQRRADAERPAFDTRAKYARPETPAARVRARTPSGAGGASAARPEAILTRLLRAVDGSAPRVREAAASAPPTPASLSDAATAATGNLPVNVLQRLLRAVDGADTPADTRTLDVSSAADAASALRVSSMELRSPPRAGGACSPLPPAAAASAFPAWMSHLVSVDGSVAPPLRFRPGDAHDAGAMRSFGV